MQAAKLLFAGIVAFSLLAEYAKSNEAEKYYEQVIYIESLRFRAHWLDSRGWVYFTEASERDLIDKTWAKWVVWPGPDGTITLESMEKPRCYLFANGEYSRCSLLCSSYPNGDNKFLWYLERRSDDAMELRSKRYATSRLDAHHELYAALSSGSKIWHRLRIFQPPTSESRVLISTYDNSKGNTKVTHTYTERIGISKTTSTSISITAEVGLEIKKVFTAKLSATWSYSKSQTWSKETEKTVAVDVLPGYVKRIYQLKGTYGPLEISSSYLFFEDSLEKK